MLSDAAKARTAEACGAIGVIFGSTGETFAAKSDGKDVGIPCVMVEKSIYDQVVHFALAACARATLSPLSTSHTQSISVLCLRARSPVFRTDTSYFTTR